MIYPNIGGKFPPSVQYIVGLMADNLVGEFHCGRIGANTFHSRSLDRLPFCRNGRGLEARGEKSRHRPKLTQLTAEAVANRNDRTIWWVQQGQVRAGGPSCAKLTRANVRCRRLIWRKCASSLKNHANILVRTWVSRRTTRIPRTTKNTSC